MITQHARNQDSAPAQPGECHSCNKARCTWAQVECVSFNAILCEPTIGGLRLWVAHKKQNVTSPFPPKAERTSHPAAHPGGPAGGRVNPGEQNESNWHSCGVTVQPLWTDPAPQQWHRLSRALSPQRRCPHVCASQHSLFGARSNPISVGQRSPLGPSNAAGGRRGFATRFAMR